MLRSRETAARHGLLAACGAAANRRV